MYSSTEVSLANPLAPVQIELSGNKTAALNPEIVENPQLDDEECLSCGS